MADSKLRELALAHAVETCRHMSPAQVVETAEMYLKFLNPEIITSEFRIEADKFEIMPQDKRHSLDAHSMP